ncbi:hypothetical protein CALCODRAFT_485070 [Calocera cornea HHB12733]|uniref:Uncharacterized protein n=1 Tax=Calocera cornea HHB12733 TaxID=1353952 RepID=A0A165EJZ7_9BASI|nr:hypothetical protein CALCODRAFT_485070 [Calocera cornea HHB12733]
MTTNAQTTSYDPVIRFRSSGPRIAPDGPRIRELAHTHIPEFVQKTYDVLIHFWNLNPTANTLNVDVLKEGLIRKSRLLNPYIRFYYFISLSYRHPRVLEAAIQGVFDECELLWQRNIRPPLLSSAAGLDLDCLPAGYFVGLNFLEWKPRLACPKPNMVDDEGGLSLWADVQGKRQQVVVPPQDVLRLLYGQLAVSMLEGLGVAPSVSDQGEEHKAQVQKRLHTVKVLWDTIHETAQLLGLDVWPANLQLRLVRDIRYAAEGCILQSLSPEDTILNGRRTPQIFRFYALGRLPALYSNVPSGIRSKWDPTHWFEEDKPEIDRQSSDYVYQLIFSQYSPSILMSTLVDPQWVLPASKDSMELYLLYATDHLGTFYTAYSLQDYASAPAQMHEDALRALKHIHALVHRDFQTLRYVLPDVRQIPAFVRQQVRQAYGYTGRVIRKDMIQQVKRSYYEITPNRNHDGSKGLPNGTSTLLNSRGDDNARRSKPDVLPPVLSDKEPPGPAPEENQVLDIEQHNSVIGTQSTPAADSAIDDPGWNSNADASQTAGIHAGKDAVDHNAPENDDADVLANEARPVTAHASQPPGTTASTTSLEPAQEHLSTVERPRKRRRRSSTSSSQRNDGDDNLRVIAVRNPKPNSTVGEVSHTIPVQDDPRRRVLQWYYAGADFETPIWISLKIVHMRPKEKVKLYDPKLGAKAWRLFDAVVLHPLEVTAALGFRAKASDTFVMARILSTVFWDGAEKASCCISSDGMQLAVTEGTSVYASINVKKNCFESFAYHLFQKHGDGETRLRLPVFFSVLDSVGSAGGIRRPNRGMTQFLQEYDIGTMSHDSLLKWLGRSEKTTLHLSWDGLGYDMELTLKAPGWPRATFRFPMLPTIVAPNALKFAGKNLTARFVIDSTKLVDALGLLREECSEVVISCHIPTEDESDKASGNSDDPDEIESFDFSPSVFVRAQPHGQPKHRLFVEMKRDEFDSLIVIRPISYSYNRLQLYHAYDALKKGRKAIMQIDDTGCLSIKIDIPYPRQTIVRCGDLHLFHGKGVFELLLAPM